MSSITRSSWMVQRVASSPWSRLTGTGSAAVVSWWSVGGSLGVEATSEQLTRRAVFGVCLARVAVHAGAVVAVAGLPTVGGCGLDRGTLNRPNAIPPGNGDHSVTVHSGQDCKLFQ